MSQTKFVAWIELICCFVNRFSCKADTDLFAIAVSLMIREERSKSLETTRRQFELEIFRFKQKFSDVDERNYIAEFSFS